MITLYRGASLAAVAVIAVSAIALAAGPAQARGGLKAQTVELLPVEDLDTGAESNNGNPNANASAVTAFDARSGTQYTGWTAIAEDLLASNVYGLYNLRSGVEDCKESDFIGEFPTDIDGNLTPAMTIETVNNIPVANVVYVCRETNGPVLILSGEFTGGASGGGKGGGKNPNK